jgi:hypothetical protein
MAAVRIGVKEGRWSVIDLESLLAIDRLEIGPVKVEGQRLVAPYTVHRGGGSESTDLTYLYEKAVFDPKDESAVKLASVIAAQVALNYGLFCREIVFHGPFDRHDRGPLAEMEANTAREIDVKKFLEPNPFLLGDPTRATADKGRSVWKIMVVNLVELVEELKGLTLDEIYERRY